MSRQQSALALLSGYLRCYPHWSAPLILVVVAAVQISLSFGRDLTPWKGGGFGMFASFSDGGRYARYYAIREGERVRISNLRGLGDLEERLRIMPTEAIARQIAERLEAVPHPTGFKRLSIELWETRLTGHQVASTRIREYEFPLGPARLASNRAAAR